MDMEDKLILMEIIILVNLKMINLKALENMYIMLVQAMLENSKMIKKMEMANLLKQMAISMKVIG